MKKIKSPVEEYILPVKHETAWFLPHSTKVKIVFKKRKPIPQEIIDMMNGKKVKMYINTKDWKMTLGSIE